MIAVDTNLLVYSHRQDSDWHSRALPHLRMLAQNPQPWAIPWPCVAEFYSVVTHARIYKNPTLPRVAIAQINAWISSPSLVLLGESASSWGDLEHLLEKGQVRGGAVHDARIAALCLSHGVSELWSADKDFSRFPTLKVRNPLI